MPVAATRFDADRAHLQPEQRLSGRRTGRSNRQQPQTPPCEEQQPCFFAQLVQVGESVPSQQRNVPPGCGWGCGCGCGALTVIDSVR
jgi:hypothetical protein